MLLQHAKTSKQQGQRIGQIVFQFAKWQRVDANFVGKFLTAPPRHVKGRSDVWKREFPIIKPHLHFSIIYQQSQPLPVPAELSRMANRLSFLPTSSDVECVWGSEPQL